MLVKREAAQAQIEEDASRTQADARGQASEPDPVAPPVADRPAVPPPPPPAKRTRFFGTVNADPERLGRAAGRIAEEILSYLTTQPNACVEVSLEIRARVPDGLSADDMRTIKENCAALKFRNCAFEEE